MASEKDKQIADLQQRLVHVHRARQAAEVSLRNLRLDLAEMGVNVVERDAWGRVKT